MVELHHHHMPFGDGGTHIHPRTIHVHDPGPVVVPDPRRARGGMRAPGWVDANGRDVARLETGRSQAAPFIGSRIDETATKVQTIPIGAVFPRSTGFPVL